MGSKGPYVIALIGLIIGAGGLGTGAFSLFMAVAGPVPGFNTGVINTYYDLEGISTSVFSDSTVFFNSISIDFTIARPGVQALLYFESYALTENGIICVITFVVDGTEITNPSTATSSENMTSISLTHIMTDLAAGAHNVKVQVYRYAGAGQANFWSNKLMVQTFVS